MATYTQLIAPSSAYRLSVTITQKSQSVTGNSSVITVVGSITGVNSYYTAVYSSSTNSVNINGTTYSPTTAYNIGLNKSTQIFSYEQTIPHNADGSKTVSVSWTFNGKQSSYNPNGTISCSQALTTIPRASSITSVGNTSYGSTVPIVIARNSTSFTHDVTVALPGKSMTITGVATSTSPTIPIDWLTGYPSGSNASGTVTVQTKNGSTNIGSAVSKSFTCSVPGASSFTVANTSYGSNITATISRNRSEYTHAVAFELPGNKATFSNVGTSQGYTIPLSWLNQYTSGTSATATVIVHTYYGSRLIGSSTKTCAVAVPSNIVPTVSIARTAFNSGLSGFTEPIQGISTMTLTRTAGGAYSSTITRTEWWGDGISASSSSAVSFTAMQKNPQYIYCKVTDSRGRVSTTATYTSWNHEYSNPTLSLSDIGRCDVSNTFQNDGTYFRFKPTFTFTSLGGVNTVTMHHKVNTSPEWTYTSTSPVSGATYGPDGAGRLDKTKAYTVTVTLTDKVGRSVVQTRTIPVSEVLLNFPSGANALGIGMYSQGAGCLDVGYHARMRGDFTTNMSRTGVNLKTQGWYTVFEWEFGDSNNSDWAYGTNFILTLNRTYGHINNEAHTFIVSCAYQNIRVSQLCGTSNVQAFTTLRFMARDYDSATGRYKFKIEVYYNTNLENNCYATVITNASEGAYLTLPHPKAWTPSTGTGTNRSQIVINANKTV